MAAALETSVVSTLPTGALADAAGRTVDCTTAAVLTSCGVCGASTVAEVSAGATLEGLAGCAVGTAVMLEDATEVAAAPEGTMVMAPADCWAAELEPAVAVRVFGVTAAETPPALPDPDAAVDEADADEPVDDPDDEVDEDTDEEPLGNADDDDGCGEVADPADVGDDVLVAPEDAKPVDEPDGAASANPDPTDPVADVFGDDAEDVASLGAPEPEADAPAVDDGVFNEPDAPVSAAATPDVLATAHPTPSTTASAPTRPT
jgi:hypothetical protein